MKSALVVLAVLVFALPSLAREDTETLKRLFKEGNALMEQGKHAEALAKYQAVLAIEPKAKGSLYNGGLAAYFLGKHDLAIGLWTRRRAAAALDLAALARRPAGTPRTGARASAGSG